MADGSYRMGLRLAFSRAPLGWWLIAAGVSTLLTTIGLLLEHRSEPSMSADNTLVSVTFGVVIPIMTSSAVARVFPTRTDLALGSVARHGAPRRALLLGAGVGLAAAVSVLTAALAVVTRVLGGSLAAQGLGDVATCAWIGALAGLAYTAWFLFGSSFGARARGRWIALFLDWGFGVGTGVLALPWPRGHLRSLLGGGSVAGLEQWHSSLALLVLATVYACWTLWRTPR